MKSPPSLPSSLVSVTGARPARRGSLPAWAAVGAVAALLYVATMAPTLLWGDDAELQRIVLTGEPRVVGQSSRASHLLWLALAARFNPAVAWLPLDAAGRTTLFSALCAALALPWVFLAGEELGAALGVGWRGARASGLVAATTLGLSHTFWLLAVRPDVYGLQTAFLAAALWCVLRWRRPGGRAGFLVAAAGLVAAALLNHLMIVFSAPALLWLAAAVPAGERGRVVRALAAAVVLGLLLVLAGWVAGFPLLELTRTILAARPHPPGLRDLATVPAFLLYQFPLSLPLSLAGLALAWRRSRPAAGALLLLYLGNLVPVLVLQVRDRFLFFLPSYMPVALLAGLGAGGLLDGRLPLVARRWPGAARRLRPALGMLVAAPLVLYPLAAWTGSAVAARLAPARQLPGRDPLLFYLWPGKTAYAGARTYGERAMVAMDPDAAILADWLPYQTLRYLQRVEGRRPDVLLLNVNAGEGAQLRSLLEQQGRRPLYLADNAPPPYYEMAEIERCFAVQRQDVVYRLTWRGAGDCRQP